MDLTPTDIPDVQIIEPRVYKDSRGSFMETYHERRYRDAGIDCRFVQDNLSLSCRRTLRGLHYQVRHPQAKLVQVIAGEVFDVAVDIRPQSAFFGRWAGVLLTGENRRQLFIPEGFAHGSCVVSALQGLHSRADLQVDTMNEHGSVYIVLRNARRPGIKRGRHQISALGKRARHCDCGIPPQPSNLQNAFLAAYPDQKCEKFRLKRRHRVRDKPGFLAVFRDRFQDRIGTQQRSLEKGVHLFKRFSELHC